MPTPKGRKVVISITLTHKEVEMVDELMKKLGFTSRSPLIAYLIREKHRAIFGELPARGEERRDEPEVLPGRPPGGNFRRE